MSFLSIIFNNFQNSEFSSALICEICRFQKTHHRRFCQLFSTFFKTLNSHQLSLWNLSISEGSSSTNLSIIFNNFSKLWILISSHPWNLSGHHPRICQFFHDARSECQSSKWSSEETGRKNKFWNCKTKQGKLYAMLAQLKHLVTGLKTELLKTFATKMKDVACQVFKEDRTLLKTVLKTLVT